MNNNKSAPIPILSRKSDVTFNDDFAITFSSPITMDRVLAIDQEEQMFQGYLVALKMFFSFANDGPIIVKFSAFLEPMPFKRAYVRILESHNLPIPSDIVKEGEIEKSIRNNFKILSKAIRQLGPPPRYVNPGNLSSLSSESSMSKDDKNSTQFSFSSGGSNTSPSSSANEFLDDNESYPSCLDLSTETTRSFDSTSEDEGEQVLEVEHVAGIVLCFIKNRTPSAQQLVNFIENLTYTFKEEDRMSVNDFLRLLLQLKKISRSTYDSCCTILHPGRHKKDDDDNNGGNSSDDRNRSGTRGKSTRTHRSPRASRSSTSETKTKTGNISANTSRLKRNEKKLATVLARVAAPQMVFLKTKSLKFERDGRGFFWGTTYPFLKNQKNTSSQATLRCQVFPNFDERLRLISFHVITVDRELLYNVQMPIEQGPRNVFRQK